MLGGFFYFCQILKKAIQILLFLITIAVHSQQLLNYNELNFIAKDSSGLSLVGEDARLNSLVPLGDLDGDGNIELILSGLTSDSLYLIYLDHTVGVSSYKVINIDQIGTQFNGSENKEYRSIGDLDGDSINEIAISDLAAYEFGEIIILFFDRNGDIKDYSTIHPLNDIGNGIDAIKIRGYGREILSLGDIDGDNIPDIAISADEDTVRNISSGVVLITYLNSDGSVKNQKPIFPKDSLLFPNGAPGYGWGSHIAILGDIDKNGVDDWLVSTGIGICYTVMFNEDFSIKKEIKHDIDHPLFGNIINEINEMFTSIISVPDIDMDGVNEFIFGHGSFNTMEGIAVIGFIDSTGSWYKIDSLNENTVDGLKYIGGPQTHQFGLGLSYLGDLNGDFFPEVAIGAPIRNNGSDMPGGVHIISIYPDDCVNDECVWPGDANKDGVVDSRDVVQIGRGFNEVSDKKRTLGITEWTDQKCDDWTQDRIGVNLKHSDADGNGIIDFSDAMVVQKNYAQVSLKMDELIVTDPNGPPLYLIPSKDTVYNADSIELDIYLGDSTKEAENIYGVTMVWEHDVPEVYGSTNTASFNGSWLGTKNVDMLAEGYPLSSGIDVGMARIDQQNKSGQGYLSTIKVIMPDNLGEVITDFTLELTDLLIVSYGGDTLDPNIIYGEPVIIVKSEEVNSLEEGLTIFPNPNSGILNVASDIKLDQVVILDLSGRIILTTFNPTNLETYDLSGLSKGIYTIRVKSGGQSAYKKFIIK